MTVLAAGQVQDGPILGATVRYANGSSDATTTTDADGHFSITGGFGPLIVEGGVDVTTGLALGAPLMAPEGASVVSPLTTLVERAYEALRDQDANATVADANAFILAAFGLPAGVDLTTLDVAKAAADPAVSNHAAALAAYKAGAELLGAASPSQTSGPSPTPPTPPCSPSCKRCLPARRSTSATPQP